MPASAGGEDRTRRRWRRFLTAFGWMLVVHAGLGLLSGAVAELAGSRFSVDGLTEQLEIVGMGVNAGAIDDVARQVLAANRVAVLANLVLLAGSIGLLLRQKWGWFTVIVLHVAEFVLVIVWGLPLIQRLFNAVAPGTPSVSSVLVVALTALVPVSIVTFLMLRGVVEQFHRRAADPASP